MSTDDNDTHDSELKSYLEGDGISATYRKASNEMPPPALDALILGKAREAVGTRVDGRRNSWRGVYQLAASFVVGILITSLYYNAPDDAAISQESVLPVAVSTGSPSVAPAPAAERVLETTALSNDLIQVNAIRATRSEPAPFRTAADDSRAATFPLIQGNAAFNPPQAAPALQPPDQTEPSDRVELASLEEMQVTGSRLRLTDDARPYRDSREAWRAEILKLAAEVSELTTELEDRTARLEEEKALFLQVFPNATADELASGQERAE